MAPRGGGQKWPRPGPGIYTLLLPLAGSRVPVPWGLPRFLCLSHQHIRLGDFSVSLFVANTVSPPHPLFFLLPSVLVLEIFPVS